MRRDSEPFPERARGRRRAGFVNIEVSLFLASVVFLGLVLLAAVIAGIAADSFWSGAWATVKKMWAFLILPGIFIGLSMLWIVGDIVSGIRDRFSKPEPPASP